MPQQSQIDQIYELALQMKGYHGNEAKKRVEKARFDLALLSMKHLSEEQVIINQLIDDMGKLTEAYTGNADLKFGESTTVHTLEMFIYTDRHEPISASAAVNYRTRRQQAKAYLEETVGLILNIPVELPPGSVTDDTNAVIHIEGVNVDFLSLAKHINIKLPKGIIP